MTALGILSILTGLATLTWPHLAPTLEAAAVDWTIGALVTVVICGITARYVLDQLETDPTPSTLGDRP